MMDEVDFCVLSTSLPMAPDHQMTERAPSADDGKELWKEGGDEVSCRISL